AYNQKNQIQANFIPLGSLEIRGDADAFKVSIWSYQDRKDVYNKIDIKRTQAFYLPEGRYIVTFHPLEGSSRPNKPIDVTIRTGAPRILSYNYGSDRFMETPQPTPQAPESSQSGIVVNSNIPATSLSVQNISQKEPVLIGHYTGKNIYIPLQAE